MITITRTGRYDLIETKKEVKILYLDGTPYAWIVAKDIGEILVLANSMQQLGKVLSIGDYVIYDVKNEPKLTDLQHLELELDTGKWQGYLLLTGLPSATHRMKRIIPTDELIFDSSEFRTRQITEQPTKAEKVNRRREEVRTR